MVQGGEDVYCTLLMSDSYLPGAKVLAHSLRDSGTSKKLAVLVTTDTLLDSTITELRGLYDYIIHVDKIANSNLENLHRLDRLDLRFAFTKIHLWRQEQFRKIVYIDADVVALRAPDELFDLKDSFAAAPDVGWPDIFNSGVMVLEPNMQEYWSLKTVASSGISFDGADQGLLNEYFGNRPWHRLSFTYNCTPTSSYQYEPAFRHFGSSISMVHFIGKEKPWFQSRVHLNQGAQGVYRELLGRWWAVHDRHHDGNKTFSDVDQEGSMSAQLQASDSHGQGQQAAATSKRASPAHHLHVHFEEPIRASGFGEIRANQAELERPPPSEERPFIPPSMAWDATRSEPPAKSEPEASKFPSSHYEMSRNPGLFRPPKSYPEPPKDMYYKVPESKPAVYEKPPPIFPWEHKARKPTRVFDDDPPQEPEVVLPLAASKAEAVVAPRSLTSPIGSFIPTDPWENYTRKNAWDEVPSIDHYVRLMKQSQDRRAKVQVLHDTRKEGTTTPPRGGTISPSRRRESLILTDFPTEIERPSLPVTPAPIHRPTFWGDERSSVSELPGAAGVPEQALWNPLEKLEELRRSSIRVPEELPLASETPIPTRSLPQTSVDPSSSAKFPAQEVPLGIVETAAGIVPATAMPAPPPEVISFRRPNFRRGNGRVAAGNLELEEEEAGPTEYSIA